MTNELEKGYGPPDSANTLWYHPVINRFEDECGYILHDLHQYFNTWQLDAWKKTKEYALMTDKTGGLWEVFYCEDRHAEFGMCDHQCLTCVRKCEIWWLVVD